MSFVFVKETFSSGKEIINFSSLFPSKFLTFPMLSISFIVLKSFSCGQLK